MSFKILTFGIAREVVGDNLILDDPGVSDVAALRVWLSENYPATKGLSKWAIAVNEEYAGDDTTINNGDEVAIIPPVSGG